MTCRSVLGIGGTKAGIGGLAGVACDVTSVTVTTRVATRPTGKWDGLLAKTSP
jgi:hypothetical protein